MVPLRNRRVQRKDRLSDLPDCLIFYIFSFLDTKYIVQCSLLSKRYQCLWTLATKFLFEEKNYLSFELFAKFINKVLKKVSTIFSIDLRVDNFMYSALLSSVVEYVILHPVKHISFKFSNCSKLLSPIFECQAIETLHIPYESCLLPKSFNFPVLTSLFLDNATFNDRTFASAEPFSACPNLKNLTLNNVSANYLNVLIIIGHQLLNLDISFQRVIRVFELRIQAPKLLSFKYYGGAYINVSALSSFPSIEKIDINCLKGHNVCPRERGLRVLMMLEHFHQAKHFKLRSKTIEVLGYSLTNLTRLKLPSLEIIEIDLPTHLDGIFYIVSYLLRHSRAAGLARQMRKEEVFWYRDIQSEPIIPFYKVCLRIEVTGRPIYHLEIINTDPLMKHLNLDIHRFLE